MDRSRVARSRVARSRVLAAAVLVLITGSATPALGHASGQLPYAWWSADGHQVVAEWTAPADDAALIGTAVGGLRAGASEAYLDGPADAFPTDEEIAALSASPQLAHYLLDNLGVRQNGVDCAAEVEPARDFITEGARFEFTCPEPVADVELWVTMLHDQDPAYQTLSGDGTIQDARHTAAAPAQPWDFTMTVDGPRGAPVVLYLAVGAAVAVGLLSIRSVRT